MGERDREREPGQPDPTHDDWSAWLPQLDSPTSPPTAELPPQQASPQAPPPPWPPPAPPRRTRLPQASLPQLPPPPSANPTFAQPPPSYLGSAILCTILCFLPFGIVAVVKAASVNSLWVRGRVDEARQASRSARRWCLLAALVWPGLLIVMAAVFILIGFARVFG